MYLINLANVNAILALFAVIAGLIKREKKKNNYLIILGIAVCIVSLIDNCNQKKTDTENKKTISHLDSTDTGMRDSLSDFKKATTLHLASIDSSLKPYNLKLDGDKVVPINITFTDNSQNVTSNYQKNGQTAHTINNNNK